MTSSDGLRQQLDSLHAISVEIAALHDIAHIHDRALSYCLELTSSAFAFTGLLVDGEHMDVAAIKGFEPVDEDFYETFHLMAVRRSVVGVTIRDGRPNISNDVLHDPHSVGQPPGHPPVRCFLGVPLRVGTRLIGMIGVANKSGGYGAEDERILATLANQVAVAIDNARLYERQRQTIASLQQLHDRLGETEQAQLLARERQRIAGRLHDQIEQEIFSIGLGVNALLEHDLDPSVAEGLRAIRSAAIATAEEVRKAIFALAVPGNGQSDLTSSVRSLLRDLERSSSLETHLFVTGTASPSVETYQDVLYSAVKEALSNVDRHAQARRVLVNIRFRADRVEIVIGDDGVGIPDIVLSSFQDSYLHFGLRHVRDEMLQIGGTFEAARGDEGGTVVRFSAPLDRGLG